MELLYIPLLVVALVATAITGGTLGRAVVDREIEHPLFTVVCAVIALVAGFGSYANYTAFQTTWQPGDAVVRVIFSEDDDTMLLTRWGTVYRCDVAAECSMLEKGDHVTFEQLREGTSIPGTSDIRKVVKD